MLVGEDKVAYRIELLIKTKIKMKNWKTTLAGVIVSALGIATYMGWITADVAGAITTIAVSLGLVVASDVKKED
jgi:hypothetical protein